MSGPGRPRLPTRSCPVRPRRRRTTARRTTTTSHSEIELLPGACEYTKSGLCWRASRDPTESSQALGTHSHQPLPPPEAMDRPSGGVSFDPLRNRDGRQSRSPLRPRLHATESGILLTAVGGPLSDRRRSPALAPRRPSSAVLHLPAQHGATATTSLSQRTTPAACLPRSRYSRGRSDQGKANEPPSWR
jgi:hypothetical protein